VKRALRRCPVCRADAVEDFTCLHIDLVESRIELCCGQCGTWRRLVVTRAAVRRYERALGRDRRAIEQRLRRLESGDVRALTSALRKEIGTR
jgi:hypothetical protein